MPKALGEGERKPKDNQEEETAIPLRINKMEDRKKIKGKKEWEAKFRIPDQLHNIDGSAIAYLDKGEYGEGEDLPLSRNFAPEGMPDFKVYFKGVMANEKDKFIGD